MVIVQISSDFILIFVTLKFFYFCTTDLERVTVTKDALEATINRVLSPNNHIKRFMEYVLLPPEQTGLQFMWGSARLYQSRCNKRARFTSGGFIVALRRRVRSTGLILGLRPANERRRFFVTTSLIGWVQTWNHPWKYMAATSNHQGNGLILCSLMDTAQQMSSHGYLCVALVISLLIARGGKAN